MVVRRHIDEVISFLIPEYLAEFFCLIKCISRFWQRWKVILKIGEATSLMKRRVKWASDFNERQWIKTSLCDAMPTGCRQILPLIMIHCKYSTVRTIRCLVIIFKLESREYLIIISYWNQQQLVNVQKFQVIPGKVNDLLFKVIRAFIKEVCNDHYSDSKYISLFWTIKIPSFYFRFRGFLKLIDIQGCQPSPKNSTRLKKKEILIRCT